MTVNKSEILIILDVDETLVYATRDPLDIGHDFEVGDYFVYKRPHLDTFINCIDNNYPFAIWSSATDIYVEEMAEKLALSKKVVFCWARSRATFRTPAALDTDGDLIIDSTDHQYFVKRLKKIKKLGYGLERILIIDDTPHKSKENYGNAIYISAYKGDPNDNELLAMIDYLDTLKFERNVRLIEKRNWKEKIKK